MAGRILNRRVLREQADQAEQLEAEQVEVEQFDVEQPEADDSDQESPVVKPKRKARAKGPVVPKVRKPRKLKAPPRVRARWGVFDGGMKQVAVFDYNQRAAADEKLADLLTKKKGSHFMQIVKDLMPEPVVAPSA